MELLSHVKPAIITLLTLYSSALCLYLVMARRLFSYFQISHLNQIQITLPMVIFAFTRCIFLFVGRRLNRTWCNKIAQLIGLLELLTIISTASMFWMFNLSQHTKTIERIVVAPILFVINLAAHLLLFYSTWNNTIVVENVMDLHEINIVTPGILQYLK